MRIIARLINFFSSTLWRADIGTLSVRKRLYYRILRLLFVTFREFREGLFSLRAMSLVFTTLLSLVPLLAVIFSTLKAFGVHNRLQPLILELLTPLGARGLEITERIISFIDNLRVGVLGAVGVLALFLTIVSLMEKVEGALNHIWKVKKLRSLPRRFSDYLSVILLGPLLLFLSLGAIASLKSNAIVQHLLNIEPWGLLVPIIARYLPYVGISLAFAFLYVFIPNTRVRFQSALIGGIAGGLLWLWAGRAFAFFVASTARYDLIYSSFATLILFFLWLYVAWTIILVGAQVAFFHQNPQALTNFTSHHFGLPVVREYMALSIMAEVAKSYLRGGPPPSSWDLCVFLAVPEPEIKKIIETQVEADLLRETAGEPAGLVPAHPPDSISVKHILDGVRCLAEKDRQWIDNPRTASVAEILRQRDRATAELLEPLTLKDLAEERLKFEGQEMKGERR